MNGYPKVGIGVMIFKGGKILLSQRKKGHGVGQYAFPGGHFEYMESFEGCARRELREECGDMEVGNIRFLFLANLKQYAPRHYVHIGLAADWVRGEPQNTEPEKHEAWEWFDLDNLPKERFNTPDLSIESYKTRKNYFDL